MVSRGIIVLQLAGEAPFTAVDGARYATHASSILVTQKNGVKQGSISRDMLPYAVNNGFRA